ncbi:MAG: CRISPR-associated endonuclease Cas6 [Candidatus Eremiobacteraeota bacterium]|nr:CRISPR-associated endonuclease Cas6 [Candidatus Eremiobacteraeota bacterium]
MSIRISQSILKIVFDRPLEKCVQVKDLRGAIARLYPDEVLLHQHREDGSLTYTYPFIQYKILKGECLVIGFQNGADVLTRLDLLSHILTFGNYSYTVIANELNFRYVIFEMCDKLQNYSFITPWLALNEKNFEKYFNSSLSGSRKSLLEKILIGNIISVSKSLGYTVPGQIYADFSRFKEVPTSLKGIPMTGFIGSFSVNFSIPDLWGLGKSVSRGFGTVVKKL